MSQKTLWGALRLNPKLGIHLRAVDRRETTAINAQVLIDRVGQHHTLFNDVAMRGLPKLSQHGRGK